MKTQSQELASPVSELSACQPLHSAYKNHVCIKTFTWVPSGHYFNTSKQSNYQCHYVHSIVMELMLWQIVGNASFHGHGYSKSCVSSDCLWSPSTVHPPSVFRPLASKVTSPLLFQPISRSCFSYIALLSGVVPYRQPRTPAQNGPFEGSSLLLFPLINNKTWLLLHITGVENMSCGEHSEMKENVKELKWALRPELF